VSDISETNIQILCNNFSCFTGDHFKVVQNLTATVTI